MSCDVGVYSLNFILIWNKTKNKSIPKMSVCVCVTLEQHQNPRENRNQKSRIRFQWRECERDKVYNTNRHKKNVDNCEHKNYQIMLILLLNEWEWAEKHHVVCDNFNFFFVFVLTFRYHTIQSINFLGCCCCSGLPTGQFKIHLRINKINRAIKMIFSLLLSLNKNPVY